jgi:hypothetical protein
MRQPERRENRGVFSITCFSIFAASPLRILIRHFVKNFRTSDGTSAGWDRGDEVEDLRYACLKNKIHKCQGSFRFELLRNIVSPRVASIAFAWNRVPEMSRMRL